jgi:hypothetical protein
LGRAKRLRFADLPCRLAQHQDLSGNTHILLGRGARQTQLFITGDTDTKHDVYVSFLVERVDRVRCVAQASEQFDRLMHGETFEDFVLQSQLNDHLKAYLIALDGHLAGRSYREIAQVIYGVERVKDVWTSESQFLKDRVRRAVMRGIELMNGGYRDLL